jgi:hypothetical protein
MLVELGCSFDTRSPIGAAQRIGRVPCGDPVDAKPVLVGLPENP